MSAPIWKLTACDLATKSGIAWWDGEIKRPSFEIEMGPIVAGYFRPALQRDGLADGYEWALELVHGKRAKDQPAVIGFKTDLAFYAWLPKVFPRMLDGGGYTFGPYAWARPDHVVMEKGHGDAPRSVDQLAWRRGYVAACAHNVDVQVTEIGSSTWAGLAGKHFGDTFPKGSAARKAHSLKLAERQGIALPARMHDVADAVNLGLAAVITNVGNPRKIAHARMDPALESPGG